MQASTDLNELFSGLLRSGLHPEVPYVPAAPVGEASWQEIFSLAKRQGTANIALDGVETLPREQRPGRELRIRWAMQSEATVKRYARQRSAAERAARLLAGHGVRMLVLKGIGLSDNYPIAEHRECGDVDIYLFGDHEKGNRILCDAGAQRIDDVPKHTGLALQGVHIENHRTFLNVSRNREERELDGVLSEILRREGAIPAPGGFFTPPATFNAIYLVRHAAQHFLKEGITARHLCDWSCFLERQEQQIDRELFTQTLRRYRMERFERLLTAAAIRCCGLQTAMPGHDPAELDRFIGEVLAYQVPDANETLLKHLLRKCRTPYAHRWRFRLLGVSLAHYYREALLAQRREKFTLFR